MTDGVKHGMSGMRFEDLDTDVQSSDCIPDLLSRLFDWEEEEAIRI
jgi:hypothetical protein